MHCRHRTPATGGWSLWILAFSAGWLAGIFLAGMVRLSPVVAADTPAGKPSGVLLPGGEAFGQTGLHLEGTTFTGSPHSAQANGDPWTSGMSIRQQYDIELAGRIARHVNGWAWLAGTAPLMGDPGPVPPSALELANGRLDLAGDRWSVQAAMRFEPVTLHPWLLREQVLRGVRAAVWNRQSGLWWMAGRAGPEGGDSLGWVVGGLGFTRLGGGEQQVSASVIYTPPAAPEHDLIDEGLDAAVGWEWFREGAGYVRAQAGLSSRELPGLPDSLEARSALELVAGRPVGPATEVQAHLGRFGQGFAPALAAPDVEYFEPDTRRMGASVIHRATPAVTLTGTLERLTDAAGEAATRIDRAELSAAFHTPDVGTAAGAGYNELGVALVADHVPAAGEAGLGRRAWGRLLLGSLALEGNYEIVDVATLEQRRITRQTQRGDLSLSSAGYGPLAASVGAHYECQYDIDGQRVLEQVMGLGGTLRYAAGGPFDLEAGLQWNRSDQGRRWQGHVAVGWNLTPAARLDSAYRLIDFSDTARQGTAYRSGQTRAALTVRF